MKVNSRLEDLTVKMIDGTVPQDTYERMRDKWLAEKNDLDGQLMKLRVQQRSDPVRLPPHLVEDWQEIPADVRREILLRLISKIIVKPGRPRSEVRIVPLWEENS